MIPMANPTGLELTLSRLEVASVHLSVSCSWIHRNAVDPATKTATSTLKASNYRVTKSTPIFKFDICDDVMFGFVVSTGRV